MTSSSNSFCAKCGRPVPVGAEFCPGCGTQISPVVADSTQPTIAPTRLVEEAVTFVPGANAATIGPMGVVTSLGSTVGRVGDGGFRAGDQVGPRYTIIKLLGTGGMGAVYQAFDHELGVAVAIKVIRPAAQSDATAARDLELRFKRELVLARQITHKYVVRIHDIGDVDGVKYLTMPFIEGETLADLLRREGRLPVPRVVAIARQVALGLSAAHDKGVVHRDLKPENIMIEKGDADAPGDTLIMDFGIARSMEHGSTQTAAGSVIGTLEYMAPEQAQGKKVDQRADIYAFGLILYDVLLGRQRLANRDNPMSELLARLNQAPAAPRTIDVAIPDDLDRIVQRCLQPTPDARYATTGELVQALEALTPDGHARVDIGTGTTAALPAAKRPSWHLAVAAVVVVIAGVGGWYLSNQRGASAPDAPREPISVLIADFENKTGDAVFDGVVEQALGLGIEGASFITAYPRRDALRAAAVIKPGARLDEGTARLVARREGVGLVLVGDIQSSAGSYRISTRALDAANDGATLYTLEATADGKAALLETVGTLAGKVRSALGDTAVPSAGPAASETFTAASLEAAKAYTEGVELVWAGKQDEAIVKYQEAIRLDPDMGRAYAGLAAVYNGAGRMAEAQKNLEEALARIDRMTDREKFRTRGSYYLFSRKPLDAIKEYTALVQAYPSDTVGMANLAQAQFYQRNITEALAQQRKAIAIFPRNVVRRNNLALYAMYAGQFDTAIAGSDEVLKLNPSFVKAFVVRALSEVALGRPAEAVKTYEKLKGLPAAGAAFGSAGLADLALYQGRIADALTTLDEGIAADTAAKNATGVAVKRVARADALLARGDAAGAAREAEQALAASASTEVSWTAGLVLARAGRAAAALKLAEGLAAKLEADPQAYARLIQAEASLAQGQARAAVEHARAAQQLADTWMGRVTLARAFLALGAFAEASSELDAAEKRIGEATAVALDDWPTFRYYAPVIYYKGLAQAGLKSPAAKASFAAFLALKANGDEAGGLVAAARKQLAQ